MDEVRGVSFRGALEAELTVCGHGVVEEGDTGGELAVIQHLGQVVTLPALVTLNPSH